MLPWANAKTMQLHLDEISKMVERRAHGVVLMDRAGWHTTAKLNVPKNLTIILLPFSQCKPLGTRCVVFGVFNRVAVLVEGVL